MSTAPEFEVYGQNAAAPFTLKIFRGERMALLGMNWRNGRPSDDFVGFAIEYKEPDGDRFYSLNNRLSFLQNDGSVNPNKLSTRLSPIQKFRWVHFPYHPDLKGMYTYRVTPVFMDSSGRLSYGEYQEAGIQLESETYPDILNIAFTRGFIASQAFTDRFQKGNAAQPLLPASKTNGLNFTSNNPEASDAMAWMGFEARAVILNMLDKAIADPSAQVCVTAYDLDLPEILERLVKLGNRLQIIIDSSDDHGAAASPETQAEKALIASGAKVQRQFVGGLQHNKTIAILGNNVNMAIGGSTNFSWRGFFVQNNNAVIIHGAPQVQLFFDAFKNLWDNPNNKAGFAATASACWADLNIPNVKAKLAFSPHGKGPDGKPNKCLADIATAISGTTSSLLFSLAFLYQTKGKIKDAIVKVTNTPDRFVYGISDKKVGGLDVKTPDGNLPVAFPARLLTDAPEPFNAEPTDGGGIRMHHKFVVIDFDKPTAKVYMGSYNFSVAADEDNGENLWLFEDRRIAVSYMVQAVTMFDHYEWRDAQSKAKGKGTNGKLYLKTPPKTATDKPWFDEDYTDPQKIKDRLLFS